MTVEELAQKLRNAEAAHALFEKTEEEPKQHWSEYYARYLIMTGALKCV